MWLIILKDQLSIIGLVSLYLTNYLILRGLIKQRFVSFIQDLARTVRQIPTPYAPVRHFVLNYSQPGGTIPELGETISLGMGAPFPSIHSSSPKTTFDLHVLSI